MEGKREPPVWGAAPFEDKLMFSLFAGVNQPWGNYRPKACSASSTDSKG